MRLPDWTTRQPLATGLVCCVLLGLAAGWLSTPLPDAGARRNAANAWQLPTSAQLSRFDESSFLAVLKSPAWQSAAPGADARGAARNSQKPTWSLVGVVLEPQPVALVLNTASARIDRLGIGATLPDGAQLQKIQRDSISISSNGCSKRIDVFRTREHSANQTCTGETGTASPNNAGKPR